MLSEEALARALERVGRSAPVRFYEVTRSTQETALEMALDGAPEFTLVAAAHQTAGRGRLDREWRDVRGSGLLFSFVLRPELPVERGGLLSLLAGSAMAHAIREVAGQRAACKWPNDVLVAGRKAGGILAESLVAGNTLEHVVLGIGVNLGSAPADVPGAGAVESSAEEVLQAFLDAFARGYEPAHPAFGGAVVEGYREVCATIGMRVRAARTDGTEVEGDAVDVDERGGLVVRTAEGDLVVRFGEVQHLE